MSIDNLHQKHHGIPGAGFSSGKNGQDGEGGNNVYFGYINDFFKPGDGEPKIELTSYNLARIATSSEGYYTGMFINYKGGLHKWAWDSSLLKMSDEDREDLESSTYFLEIMDVSGYPKPYVDYTFDPSTDNMRMYVKADVAEIGNGVDGSLCPYNIDEHLIGNRWLHKEYGEYPWNAPLDASNNPYIPTTIPTGIYPYVAYKGTLESIQEIDPSNRANIRPGNYSLSQSALDGFELFSIKTPSATYQFAYEDESTERYEAEYIRFEDSSNNSIDDPSISQVGVAYVRTADPSVLCVDFIKYSEKLNETIEVLDKLNKNIVAGDVIYFYTDTGDFHINKTVRYMTVITEALEGCSYQELIDAAVEINPFTFKFIDSVNKNATDYLYSTLPSVAGYYDDENVSTVDVSIYGRNMVNMLNCLGEDTALQTGIMSKSNNTLDMMCLQTSIEPGLTIEADHIDGGGKHDVSVRIDTGDAKMLKISNAYFRNTNVGNLESAGVMTPLKMVLDERQVIHSASIDDYNPDDKTFRFDKSEFFSSDVKNWRVGAVCVTFDQRQGMKPSSAVAMQCVSSKTRTYSWDETSENMSFTLTDDFGQYTSHIITMWASVKGGFRHYSDKLLVKYDTSEAAYILGTFREIEEMVNPEKAIFNISSISASKQNDVMIEILIPVAKDEPSDYTIFVNTHSVKYGGPLYSDSWSTVLELEVEEQNVPGYRKILLKATMNANLPTAFGLFDNAAAYNASSGEDNGVNGCTFFQSLLTGHKVDTESRSLNVAVNYTYKNKRHVGYTKVSQPGYVDTRSIPNVTIDLKKDLKSLEESNRSDLGVMANQFQFFVEVGIDGFDRNSWGSFVDEDDITLNMVIKNAEVDYENVLKYGIQLVQLTKTLHVNTSDERDFDKNYVRFHTYVAEPESGSMFNKTLHELDRIHYLDVSSNIIKAKDTVSCTQGYTLNKLAEYICLDDKEREVDRDIYYEMNKDYFGNTDSRPEGMQDSIEITLKNITFSKASNGKFCFRVVTEMGNPLFSMLFFKFYVSDMWINYGDNQFHVGTGNLASKVVVGNQTTYNYMFGSETLRAWLCPVSMTSIPEDKAVEKVIVQPFMTGSDLQLYTKTSLYVPKNVVRDNDSLTDSEKTSKYVKEQSMGWFDFSVKKKYFQDNVMNLQIRPMFPDDFKNTISYAEAMNMDYLGSNDWERPTPKKDETDETDAKKFSEIESNKKDDNYMSVIYNAALLGAQKRKDVNSFYYNSVIYDAEKYSQKVNKTPVMTKQNIACEIRDTSLYNAVQTWNKWFQDSPHTGEHLFRGNLTSYGNGYMYLTQKEDENLTNVAKDKDVYTPEETQLLSDSKILNKENYTYVDYNVCEQPTTIISAPEQNAWFRTLLYQTGWQYPKYYTEDWTQKRKVDLYTLTPNGKYLVDVKNHMGDAPLYEVPYNIMYSLYPRCAYDSDNDTVICFMLRCPSVVRENKWETDYSDLMFETKDTYDPIGPANLYPAD